MLIAIEMLEEMIQDRTVALGLLGYGIYHFYGDALQQHVTSFLQIFS